MNLTGIVIFYVVIINIETFYALARNGWQYKKKSNTEAKATDIPVMHIPIRKYIFALVSIFLCMSVSGAIFLNGAHGWIVFNIGNGGIIFVISMFFLFLPASYFASMVFLFSKFVIAFQKISRN